MDPATVNSFLDQFLMVLDSGFGLIEGDVRYVLNVLIVISITLAGVQWALAQEAPLAPLFRKILFVGFFVYLINNWSALSTAIHRSGAMLGIRAGGDSLTMAEFHNPGRVAGIGIELFGRMAELAEGMNVIFDFFPLIAIFLAGFFVLLGFFILGIQMFVALVAFKLGTLAAFITIPWGVFNGTAWVAERPIGWVVGSAVRLFMLALVASVSISFVDLLPETLALENGAALNVMLFGMTVLTLAWFAPMLASEVVQGQPNISGAHVMNATQNAALKFALAGYGAFKLGGAAVGGVRALAGAAGRMFSGWGRRSGGGGDEYLGVFSHHPHLLLSPATPGQIGDAHTPRLSGPPPPQLGPPNPKLPPPGPRLPGPPPGLGGPNGPPRLGGPGGSPRQGGPGSAPPQIPYRGMVPRLPPPRKPPPESSGA